MTRRIAAFLAICFVPAIGRANEADIPATWDVPAAAKVREGVLALLAERKVDAATVESAAKDWPADAAVATGADLLDKSLAALTHAEPRLAKLISACASPRTAAALPEITWLADENVPPLIRANGRLLYARWLAHHQLYDELLESIKGLEPQDVVDPASLLFYRMVASHRLLRADDCAAAALTLLERAKEIPQRYEAVARLAVADISGLKEESLDHIARRMENIGRRLDLGRPGPTTRREQDGVIESLDKMIKKIDEARQQQLAQSPSPQRPPSTPAGDSLPAGGKGPGRVDSKDIGEGRDWGDLPAKQREEALQQVGKDFPPHYREIIEEYFRRVADQEQRD